MLIELRFTYYLYKFIYFKFEFGRGTKKYHPNNLTLKLGKVLTKQNLGKHGRPHKYVYTR